ncbi:hypothetical protein DFJ74DRAFT_358723 [Hyaloraphidium curvatum]|nr:hypothetical protein DFJ74DRAFT_358723 [Hyaloraphidium curvatum]
MRNTGRGATGRRLLPEMRLIPLAAAVLLAAAAGRVAAQAVAGGEVLGPYASVQNVNGSNATVQYASPRISIVRERPFTWTIPTSMFPIDRTLDNTTIEARWIDSLDRLPSWLAFDNETRTLSGVAVAEDDPNTESVSGWVWFDFTNPALPNQTHWVSLPLTVGGNDPPLPYNMTWVPNLGYTMPATTPAVVDQYWSMQLNNTNGSFVVDPDDTTFNFQTDVKTEWEGQGFGGPAWVRYDTPRLLLEGSPSLSDVGVQQRITVKAKDLALSEARWKIIVQVLAVAPTESPTSIVPTETATPTVIPPPPDGGGGTNVGAIVGGVIGGLAAAGLIAGGLIYWNRSQKRKAAEEKPPSWDSFDEKGASPTAAQAGPSPSAGSPPGSGGVATAKSVAVDLSMPAPVQMSQLVKPVAAAGVAAGAAVAATEPKTSTSALADLTLPAVSLGSPLSTSLLPGEDFATVASTSLPGASSAALVGTKSSPPATRAVSTSRPMVTPLDVSAIPLGSLAASGSPTSSSAGRSTPPVNTLAASAVSQVPPQQAPVKVEPIFAPVKVEPIFAVPATPASAAASSAQQASQLPPVAVIIPPQIVKQQSKDNLLAYIPADQPPQPRPPSSASSTAPAALQKKTSNISLAGSTVSSSPSLHKKASSSSLTRVVPPQVIPSPSVQAVIAARASSPVSELDLAAKEAAMREQQAREAQAETQRLLVEAQLQIAAQQQQSQQPAGGKEKNSPSPGGANWNDVVTPQSAQNPQTPTTPTSPTSAGSDRSERPATYSFTRQPSQTSAIQQQRRSENMFNNRPTPVTMPLDDEADGEAGAKATAPQRQLTEAEMAKLSEVKAMLSGARSQFYEPGDMTRARSPTGSMSNSPLPPTRQGSALFDLSRSGSRENLSTIAAAAATSPAMPPRIGTGSSFGTPAGSVPPSPSRSTTSSSFLEVADPTVSASSGKYTVVDGIPCAELVAKVGRPFFYLPLTIQPGSGPAGAQTYSMKPHPPAQTAPRWLKVHYRTGGVSGLPYNNDKGEWIIDVVRTEKDTGKEEIMEVVKVKVESGDDQPAGSA